MHPLDQERPRGEVDHYTREYPLGDVTLCPFTGGGGRRALSAILYLVVPYGPSFEELAALVAVRARVIDELRAEVAELRAENAQLRSENAELKRMASRRVQRRCFWTVRALSRGRDPW